MTMGHEGPSPDRDVGGGGPLAAAGDALARAMTDWAGLASAGVGDGVGSGDGLALAVAVAVGATVGAAVTGRCVGTTVGGAVAAGGGGGGAVGRGVAGPRTFTVPRIVVGWTAQK